MQSGIIALLTDFGKHDAYVGIMKGVMLTLNPSLKLIDITHDINPYNILSASYVLYTAWDFFPQGTVFCTVVDPGVGSNRDTLIAQTGKKYLISPDNGILSLLYRMRPDVKVFRLKIEAIRYPFDKNIFGTSTFHGRDIFAPAAALCAGRNFHKIKGEKFNPLILKEVYIRTDRDQNSIIGRILHIDHFGNCISSIHKNDLNRSPSAGLPRIYVGNVVQGINQEDTYLEGIKNAYSGVEPGNPLTLIGSGGFLEISVRENNAADRLGISLNDEVRICYPLNMHVHA